MLGRVDNNCEIDTIAGPVPGLVQKPEYCLDHNYEVVLTNGGCGTGFVGVSGECQITFNPHCCVGLDEDLCPIYKGVLTVDKVVACDYEGVDANKINACPTTDNIDINVALVGPEDLDNMNSILYGCGHAISYNPGTGVMKVSEIDAETCDLSLGGGTAIVCCDCRLHTCLAGTISCDTVYEPLACCTGVSSGETLNATAIDCDGKLIKMSCVTYEASPSGYDLPLYSKVIPATSLTTNTAINTPFIYNDELSVSAKCNIVLGICPTCDSQCDWVTGAYVGLAKDGSCSTVDIYSNSVTGLKSGCTIEIRAGTDTEGWRPVGGGGLSSIEMESHDLNECFCMMYTDTCDANTCIRCCHSYSSNCTYAYINCCADVCAARANITFGCGCTNILASYGVCSCGPITVNSNCKTTLTAPELQLCNGAFVVGNCCATITPAGCGTFKGICVYDGCSINIDGGELEVYFNGVSTVEITSDGDICGQCIVAACGWEFDDWSDVDYVPNAGQIHKYVKTNGINDVVVICANCTYDSPLVDGHVYYLCFDSSMISADGSSPMAITYNWSPSQGTNCSKTYNLSYVNENGMWATYTGFDKCSGTKYYVDALAGFFVTPDVNSLKITGQAMAGKDSTGTCEYWIGRGWRSAVSPVQQSFDKARPIGSTYTQFPGTDDPNTLFNDGDITSTWTELNFAGAFFRASGGAASAFNSGVQPESIAPHYHCVCDLSLSHNHGVGSYCVWGSDALGWSSADGSHNYYLLNNRSSCRTGGFQGRYEPPTTYTYTPQGNEIDVGVEAGICLAAYNGHGFCGVSGDALGSVTFSTLDTVYPHQPAPSTYPINYTIRIWKRIA